MCTFVACQTNHRCSLSEEEQQKKPSIRTWTVRYILAHLKYLHEGGKIDLLKSRPTCIALFQHLKLDPSDLAVEILSGVEQHVLKDELQQPKLPMRTRWQCRYKNLDLISLIFTFHLVASPQHRSIPHARRSKRKTTSLSTQYRDITGALHSPLL